MSEHVIGAEFKDDDLRLNGEYVVNTGKAILRRLAGNAGIEDGSQNTFRAKGCFQLDGEGLVGRKTIPLRKAVAEGNDPKGAVIGRHRERKREE